MIDNVLWAIDPFTVIAALSPLLGLINRGGGGGDVPAELPPEIQEQLLRAMLAQGRQQSLVDPAASELFGVDQPADGVPLRPAVNQLAFSLLPNFVRPSNSLFPGVAPPMQAVGGHSLGGGQSERLNAIIAQLEAQLLEADTRNNNLFAFGNEEGHPGVDAAGSNRRPDREFPIGPPPFDITESFDPSDGEF